MSIEPFLKWPGGKRWLVNHYYHLFPPAPFRLVEPFLGGGAVFFHLSPRKALLSDTNDELVNAYRCVRSSPAHLDRRLRALHDRHDKALYYRIRESQPRTTLERAVRFLYLNRTSFNGLYRVNREGRFNVPLGSKTQVAYAEGFLDSAARALRRASVKATDFESSIDRTGIGDFVFADPPYTVMHNTNNFIKYNAHLFSWDDQVRLANALRAAAARGALVMLSNADHASVRSLYRGFGRHHRVSRPTVLAADPSRRRETTEFLLTSWR